MPRSAQAEQPTTPDAPENAIERAEPMPGYAESAREMTRVVLEQADDAKKETGGKVLAFTRTAGEIGSAAGLLPSEAAENADIADTAVKLQGEEAGELARTLVDMPDNGLREVAPFLMPPVPEKGTNVPAEAEPAKKPSDFAMAKAMRKAGREVARLEAALSKGKKTPELEAQLEAAKAEYETRRFDFVGASVDRMDATDAVQARARCEFMKKEKGLTGKVYDAWKKLGELNLEKAGWKPTSRAGKIAAKMISVRTGVSLALLGVGWAAGAGGSAAVGVTLVGRRLFGTVSTTAGAYDMLSNASEAKLAAGFSADDVKGMDRDEVVDRLEKIEANAAVRGSKRSLRGEGYKQLRARFVEIAKAEQDLRQGAGANEAEEMQKTMQAREAGSALGREEAKKGERKRKAIAATAGVALGSGALFRGLGWMGEKLGDFFGGRHVAEVTREAMTAHAPSVEHVPAPVAAAGNEITPGAVSVDAHNGLNLTPEGDVVPAEAPKLGVPAVETGVPPGVPAGEKIVNEVQVAEGSGLGHAKALHHAILEHPEDFDYDPEKNGDLAAFAKKMTKEGIHAMKLQHTGLSGHGTVSYSHHGQWSHETHGVKEYAMPKHAVAPAPEAHHAASSLEPGRFVEQPSGAPVTIETSGIKVAGYSEFTGGHVGGGPTGAPETELGTVVHEFKAPSGSAGIKSADMNGFDRFGTGSLDKVKDAALMNRILNDRTGQLHSLREAYLEAHRLGQKGLEARLFSDYNAVVHEANGKIGNIFKELQPVGETGVPGAPAVAAEAHAGAGVSSAEHAAASKPIGSEHIEPKAAANEIKLENGRELVGFKGGKLEFFHGKNGELTGVKFAEPPNLNAKEIAAAHDMLKDDALDIARGHSKLPQSLLSSTMDSRVKNLYAFRKAMAEFMKNKNLPDAEMKCLAKNIGDAQKFIADSFGEVLKKG
jgi:hypothetical protein